MHYRVQNTRTGIDFGTYEGDDEEDALDAMARDAGYKSYEDLEAQNVGSHEDIEVRPATEEEIENPNA